MNTASLDIGDVRYPGGVWRMDVKLPGQGVVDHNRWLAAISTRPAPIADLGLDPGQPGQMRNAVGTTGLALIQKVIVQLAVAINLAALLPGILDQPGLADVLPSPLAQGLLSHA